MWGHPHDLGNLQIGLNCKPQLFGVALTQDFCNSGLLANDQSRPMVGLHDLDVATCRKAARFLAVSIETDLGVHNDKAGSKLNPLGKIKRCKQRKETWNLGKLKQHAYPWCMFHQLST